MSPDRILTVRQPWATAIIRYGKDVENRTWMTDYRGRVWIHAGLKSDDIGAYPDFQQTTIKSYHLREA